MKMFLSVSRPENRINCGKDEIKMHLMSQIARTLGFILLGLRCWLRRDVDGRILARRRRLLIARHSMRRFDALD